ncbi:methyltransferase domain-containing protein [Shewanella waksmanii]|uniref:methyltransferase domain-containing protein n=1 Tax=Shewanella waksmanii TaxID=213783 RepID=UPI003735ED08
MISGSATNKHHSDCAQSVELHDEQIARHFSAAAGQYAQHDALQRMSRDVLLEHGRFASRMLDIGCGPGTALAAQGVSHTTGVDIALGMLQQARAQLTNFLPICANAECLPIQSQSIAGIYSNLALQWCDDLSLAIAEMQRVLQPRGYANIAIVTQGSLPQLQQLGLHVNPFLTAETILKSFNKQQWQLAWHETQTLTCYFDDLKQLLYSIKGVGASTHTANATQSKPVLSGRRSWQALQQKASQLRTQEGMPLSYKIVFVCAQKR